MARPEPAAGRAGRRASAAGAVRSHVLPVRVYYEDTDAAGIVYYANYLRYAERGRTEFLRAVAPDAARALRDAGAAFAVRHCAADYRRPARLDDLLEIHTRVTAIGGASLTMGQDIRRDGDSLVDLVVKLVCIDRNGRPSRLGGDLVRALDNGINELKQD